MATVPAAAEAAKVEGNRLFQLGKFAAAADAYTEAVLAAPTWAVPLVNRALCHKRRGDWARVGEDADAALRLEPSNIKAKYLVGFAALERGDAPGAALLLSKALELAREAGGVSSVEHDIWRALCRAKYDAWRGGAARRAAERDALAAHVEALLLQAGARPAASRPAAAGSAAEGACALAAEPGCVDTPPPAEAPANGAAAPAQDAPPPADGGHVPSAAARAAAAAELDAAPVAERLAALRRVFAAAAAADCAAEAPPELCCPLTLDVFRDAVIGPSGHSYERSALLDHLAKVWEWLRIRQPCAFHAVSSRALPHAHQVGAFDPLTREPLAARQLVRNVALRCAAAAWLDAHPAAYGELVAAAPLPLPESPSPKAAAEAG